MSSIGLVASIAGFVLLCGLGACASPSGGGGGGGGGGSAATPVAVADVRSVAGRWAGLVDRPGSGRDEDYLELTVNDDGTYRATAARTIGVMDARGTMQPSDGRLLVKGDGGARGTATLLSRDGAPMLRIEMTSSAGAKITARLRPQP